MFSKSIPAVVMPPFSDLASAGLKPLPWPTLPVPSRGSLSNPGAPKLAALFGWRAVGDVPTGNLCIEIFVCLFVKALTYTKKKKKKWVL